MKKMMILLIMALFVASPVQADHKHKKKHYQKKWCKAHNGQVEVKLEDKTKCDCLTSTNAIEFDFGKKWDESIGKALYSSIQTGKEAGIVLIIEKEKDMKYWTRLNTIIDHYKLPIKTWKIGSGAKDNKEQK